MNTHLIAGALLLTLTASPAYAQLGGIMKKAQKVQERKQQFDA